MLGWQVLNIGWISPSFLAPIRLLFHTPRSSSVSSLPYPPYRSVVSYTHIPHLCCAHSVSFLSKVRSLLRIALVSNSSCPLHLCLGFLCWCPRCLLVKCVVRDPQCWHMIWFPSFYHHYISPLPLLVSTPFFLCHLAILLYVPPVLASFVKCVCLLADWRFDYQGHTFPVSVVSDISSFVALSLLDYSIHFCCCEWLPGVLNILVHWVTLRFAWFRTVVIIRVLTPNSVVIRCPPLMHSCSSDPSFVLSQCSERCISYQYIWCSPILPIPAVYDTWRFRKE